MHVNDVFDIAGGILLIALVATILTKKNTAADINAAAGAFTGSIRQAQQG